MKKILIITSIIVLIIIALTAFFHFTSNSYKNNVYTTKITKQAVESNNSTLCEKLNPKLLLAEYMNSNVQPQKDCYANVAIKNKNIDACPKNWASNSDCLSRYFTYVKNTDSTTCDVFDKGPKRDECYYAQSRALYDSKFCELILSNETKSSCYQMIAELQ